MAKKHSCDICGAECPEGATSTAAVEIAPERIIYVQGSVKLSWNHGNVDICAGCRAGAFAALDKRSATPAGSSPSPQPSPPGEGVENPA